MTDKKTNSENTFKEIIALCVIISFLGGIGCVILSKRFGYEIFFSLAVTFFTTLYHFVMRILVACAVTACRKNKTEESRIAAKPSAAEKKFYGIIRIKRWKTLVPTYKPALFTVKSDSLNELMHNMVNARIGHEIMVVLSFIPILFSHILGGASAFIITSAIAAAFDMQFVLIQRYNISRLSEILKKQHYKYNKFI